MIASSLLFAVGVLAAPPSDTGVVEARRRWLRGNYEEAAALYQDLAKDPKQAEAAALGLCRCRQSEGEYDQAFEVLDAALKTRPKSADLWARRADLLYLRGRWDEAGAAAAKALALQPDQFLARWTRGRLFRDRGDLDQATKEFRWFVTAYNDKDLSGPESLLLVGLAVTEYARWNNLADQFDFILNEVYGDALKADKDFWPAEYQAGMLLLEKYNRGEALPAFDKALAINPRAAEALVGKGAAALQKLELRDAEQFAERALKINPNLVEALRLRAEVHFAGGETDKAMKDLEHARNVNPRDETTLARIAACLSLQRRNGDFDQIVREVEGRDPRAGVFYYRLAEGFEDRRRFEEAEKFYQKSVALRPQDPWARDGLGLLYMRLGQEKEARDVLTKAFEADPFNVRVSNTLKVLRHLDKYETLKTAHFQIRFDPKNDRHLARYLARYLEDVYADLSQKFQFQPKAPYLVEVFNNHEMFSGRTVALPDLHTIGACTGRMVAMVSPRGKEIAKPFNWARVVRHETVHLFNLEQTHFLVPHWLTEGLAVGNEGFPRPASWSEALARHAAKGTLKTLDDIDLGFIRPRGPEEWDLSYCQGQLYVEYLREKFGPPSIGQLLDAYRDGLSTPAALARVCKVDQKKFEEGYRVYVGEVVKGLSARSAEKPQSIDELRKKLADDPENADLTARLAEKYLEKGRRPEARRLADEALARVKDHPIASLVKARLLLAGGDDDAARQLLQAAARTSAPGPHVLALLTRLYLEAKEYRPAADVLEQARRAEPGEVHWLTELVGVYGHLADKAKLIDVLKALVPLDADDLDARRRLAQLLAEADRYVEAERYARQALEIDVLDETAQQVLGDALLRRKQYAEAVEAFSAALEANPKADNARLGLARAYAGAGDRERARTLVQEVLRNDPENADAKRIQSELNK